MPGFPDKHAAPGHVPAMGPGVTAGLCLPLQVRRMTYRILIEKEGILDMLRCVGTLHPCILIANPECPAAHAPGIMPPMPWHRRGQASAGLACGCVQRLRLCCQRQCSASQPSKPGHLLLQPGAAGGAAQARACRPPPPGRGDRAGKPLLVHPAATQALQHTRVFRHRLDCTDPCRALPAGGSRRP